jgi:dTDP-4-amino-4,6-dideoxygalactose transaminase
MIKMIDLKKQYLSIQSEIDAAIKNVIYDNAFINGKYVKTFENEFAEYIGIKHCIGVGNGSDALEISLESFNFPKGSEVIVPANSFIASAEAVTRAGHKVVFCDCNSDNYTIDIESLKLKINNNTKAIIVVHLYGFPCDIDEIMKIAKPYDIKIVEDCAQAHGAEYKGRKVGTLGDIAAFSFYPGKNLGAYGDAGAILTNDDNLQRNIRMISNHGRIDKYDHIFEGRNSRLDGIQAAVLSVKLKYLDKWVNRKTEIANYYFVNLKNLEYLKLPGKSDFVKCAYHLFVIRTKERDKLKEYLLSKDIETGIHYPISLPKLRAYKYLNQNDENFNANENDNYLLSIPIGEHLEDDEISIIVESLKEYGKS